ncbi:hypothetical protein [Companilactobacillus zhongbaensis]|uniref:hypothetical protein n=1 Tax=Companilactobacillus zhongbaensis TaxID=2486009 RepID=UPI000F79EACD|nr:hypothetical protein [Companilactobacillus zhongbaensis]
MRNQLNLTMLLVCGILIVIVSAGVHILDASPAEDKVETITEIKRKNKIKQKIKEELVTVKSDSIGDPKINDPADQTSSSPIVQMP